MGDGAEVKGGVGGGDVEMVNMGEMGEEVGYMFERDMEGLGMWGDGMGRGDVGRWGNVDGEIVDI